MIRLGLLIVAFTCLGCGDVEPPPDEAQTKKTEAKKEPSPSGPKGSTQADTQVVREQILEQLPQAAGIPLADYRILANSATAPRITSLENQPFSLVLLVLTPIGLDADPDALKQEFRYDQKYQPKPREIDEAIRTSQFPEFATYLQSDGLSDLTCEIQGPVAKGEVTFRLTNLLSGRVQYTARKTNDRWQITEFHLPTWDAHTIFKEGKWTASGAGVLPKTSFVKRPEAHWSLPRSNEVFRVPIYLGFKRSPEGQRQGTQYAFRNEMVSFEELGTQLKEALESAKQLDGKPSALVLHADVQLPVKTLLEVMRLARTAGYDQARFAVDRPFGSGSRWGELSMPLALNKPGDQGAEFSLTMRMRLLANADGQLGNLMLNNTPLGVGDAAFERLHQQTRDAVAFRNGSALIQDALGEIAADPELEWQYVIKAFSACAGKMQKQASGETVPFRFLKEIRLQDPQEEAQSSKEAQIETDDVSPLLSEITGGGSLPTKKTQKPVPPLPKHAVSKGSFSVWTKPEKPKPGQQYSIFAEINVPKIISRYPLKDLSGSLTGTDGYKDHFGGPTETGFVPVKDQKVRFEVVKVPGAAQLVKDVIEIESKILKEKQTIEIVF